MGKAGGRAACEFLEGASLGPTLLLDIIRHNKLANEE